MSQPTINIPFFSFRLIALMLFVTGVALIQQSLFAIGQKFHQAFRRDQIGQTFENVARILVILVGTMIVGSFATAFIICGLTGNQLVAMALIKTTLMIGMALIPLSLFLSARLFARPLG